MQVLYVEDPANHDDPESCVGIRHARQRARQVLLQRPAHSLRTGDLAKAGDVAGNVDDRVETAGIGEGKPITLLLTEGQMYDHKGARLMLGALPSASTLIADRGYNSNWFHAALADKGIPLCIPPTKSRKHPIDYDKTLSRQRHRIETMVAQLKDWRRIATRDDRCAHSFFSAIGIAAAVIFYLN